MRREIIMDEFMAIICRVFKTGRESIDLSAFREEIPEWDSLTHIKLVSELEEELGIEIPIEDVPSIRKLGDFLKYIEV